MVMIFTPLDAGNLCTACSWTVRDRNALAVLVARVAVGQSEHVVKIISSANLPAPNAPIDAVKSAAEMLIANNTTQRYHRDGWIFQVISWLAAHLQSPGSLVRAPQMIMAEKGFDGLQIDFDANAKAVTAVVVFEDKATVQPRSKIKSEVWPEFRRLESGGKQNVLTAEVVSLLKASHIPDPSTAVKELIWKDLRRYRVSVTGKEKNLAASRLKKLFKGYDEIAPGEVQRRRGEVLVLDDLRRWMDNFAEQVVSRIRLMGS